MTIIKSNPSKLNNEMFFPQSFNSLFNSLINENFVKNTDFIPSADVQETEKSFLIQLAVPGVKKEDLKLSVDDSILKIEGERKHEVKEENAKFHRQETSYGKFVRHFNIGKTELSNIEAQLSDGILTLTLPKELKKPEFTIEVK